LIKLEKNKLSFNIYESVNLIVVVFGLSSSCSTSSVNSVSLWITDTVRDKLAFSKRSNKRSTTVSANWFLSTFWIDDWLPFIVVSLLLLLYITSDWLVSVSLKSIWKKTKTETFLFFFF